MTRCARDVLSRDAPRETGCSRLVEVLRSILSMWCPTPED